MEEDNVINWIKTNMHRVNLNYDNPTHDCYFEIIYKLLIDCVLEPKDFILDDMIIFEKLMEMHEKDPENLKSVKFPDYNMYDFISEILSANIKKTIYLQSK